MWRHFLLINFTAFIFLFQAKSQNANKYSKTKLVDSSDLSWNAPVPSNQIYLSNLDQTKVALKFSKLHAFQMWKYFGLDSTLVSEGTWSFNPGGWLVLVSSKGLTQKYALRSFANFRFLIKDTDVKAFEKDFMENVGGRSVSKLNGRVLDQEVIDACWILSNRYYVCQE